jgi:peroxiredoxin
MHPRAAILIFAPALLAQSDGDSLSPADRYKQGHSRHGQAFDTGPRTRPVMMEDIGRAHFPITTRSPEVQKWFDQGVTLLHSFWDYEAERAFRWCLKLEPDNAMAWWGLARAAGGDRAAEFIKEAAKRKSAVTERERLYIEALEAINRPDPLRDRSDDYQIRNREYKKTLETIVVKFPDDMEARAMLALASMGDSRYGTERILREILAREPKHPGAHHYRIHNWNYHEPEQALESCRRYGEIAPGIGHAQHMPGHVYATVGMWHEAAISMDAATRVEIRRMHERMVFPYNYWNYGHNRAYLSYIQEQLGMAEAALFGARQLVEVPLDPKDNLDAPYSPHSQGINSMLRALIKFERWQELLSAKSIPWRELFRDKILKAYAETRAHIGLGDLEKAEKALAAHAALKKDLEKNKNFERLYNLTEKELKGRFAIARGDTLKGLGLLTEAAETQFEMQRGDNDPPAYPEVLYNALGRAYLGAKSPGLAVQAFEKALKLTRNDIFALAGLVEAHHALSDSKKAEEAMSQLLFTASDADKGLKLIERAQATGVRAQPRDRSPGPQRNYATAALAKYGSIAWEPFAAPRLEARDAEGKAVTLDEYRGKNVILVFYLGKECVHCMKQLQDLSGKRSDWARLDAVVLGVSPNDPTQNAVAQKGVAGVRLLSDGKFENSRRFQAYDDFEEMEIHSTILIDKRGRVHWARSGGEPFGDMNFLVRQLERMNR